MDSRNVEATQRFEGRVAVITGAASGIGEATARRLAAEGARVVIADLDEVRGSRLASELMGSGSFIHTDVRRESDIARAIDHAVERFGQLDIAFANAGVIGATGRIADSDMADVEETFAVDVLSVFATTKHAARVMIGQGSGTIISTSSPAALSGGVGAHAYSAAKAAVLGLMRSAAAELRQFGIRVNAIVPGAVVSAMTAEITVGDRGALAAAYECMSKTALLGRPIVPADIAAAVSFLASDDAALITGHTLVVDAGMTAIGGHSRFITDPKIFEEKMP